MREGADQFELKFKTHMYLANIFSPVFPFQDVEVLRLWEAEIHTKNNTTSVQKFYSGFQHKL